MKKIALLLLIQLPLLVAGMPDIVLDGTVFKGKTTYTYGLFDIATGEELVKTTVIVEVEGDVLVIDDSINESFVTLKLPSMEPFYGEKTIHYNGDYIIQCQFQGDSVIIDATTPSGEENAVVEIPNRPLLHNDQLLFSLPAMNFTVEKQKFTMFIPANASFMTAAVVVKGKEKTQVPAGEFQTYKVALDFGSDVQYSYYNVNKPHTLVLYDNGRIQYRLESITSEQ